MYVFCHKLVKLENSTAMFLNWWVSDKRELALCG